MKLKVSPYRVNYFGFPFDNIYKKNIKKCIINFLRSNKKHYISVINANKIYLMNKNKKLIKIIDDSDLILPENAINIVSLLFGRKLESWNIGGYPTMKELLSISEKNGYLLFFLGATDLVLKDMIINLKNRYKNLRIAGYSNGYFNNLEEVGIVNKINKNKPDILFVGMGSPRQELWIAKNLDRLNIKLAMGVGGSFKVLAGHEKEAPFWTKFGIEWIYRCFQDPIKFKRYIVTNAYFIYKLLKYKLDSNQRGN